MDDSGVLPSVEDEQTVYLIPSFEDDDEAESIRARIYQEIFEMKLDGWHTDESAWPKKRTFTMFKQWFHIELHSVVVDLGADEIIDADA